MASIRKVWIPAYNQQEQEERDYFIARVLAGTVMGGGITVEKIKEGLETKFSKACKPESPKY